MQENALLGIRLGVLSGRRLGADSAAQHGDNAAQDRWADERHSDDDESNPALVTENRTGTPDLNEAKTRAK